MPEVQSDLVGHKNAAGRFKRTPGRSRFRRHSIHKILASLVLLAVLAIACGTPTLPCGTFSFTGAPHANRGVNVSVTFNFNAATCGAAACNCNTICYIQIVRIIDRDTGNFLAPSTEQQNRIVTTGTPTQNGWAVDRIDNRTWGYYARFNSGTFDTYLTTGSNTTPAILNDGPGVGPTTAGSMQSVFPSVSMPQLRATTAWRVITTGSSSWTTPALLVRPSMKSE